MKIISNIMFFILVIVMLAATVMLYVLGWLIYPVLWFSHKSHEAWVRVYKKGGGDEKCNYPLATDCFT
jgi:hypothetical protein